MRWKSFGQHSAEEIAHCIRSFPDDELAAMLALALFGNEIAMAKIGDEMSRPEATS